MRICFYITVCCFAAAMLTPAQRLGDDLARDPPGIGSKRTIVLPTRLTCCFPKGSVPSFLLETNTAVL